MGVLVLGMHRSGTSALTRVLNLLGLDAGRDVLMGASESNPTGHWEVERLTSFNDRLLDELGGRWSAPPLADRARQAELASGTWGDEAAELHAEAFGGPAWVWKDPRVCLLLPFWRAVLGRSAPPVHQVVALRDPGEIAASLAARDGFSIEYGFALWERYTRTLLDDLDGERACFVPYERLLAEPEGVARELVAFCDGESVTDEPDRLAAVVAYLDERHRHQHGTVDVEGASDSQVALDEAVLGLSGAVDVFVRPSLPPETPNLQLAFDEAKRLSWYVEETDRLAEKLAALEVELDRQVTTLTAEIETRSDQASDLAEQVMLIRAEADDYLRQLEDLRNRLPMRLYSKLRHLRS